MRFLILCAMFSFQASAAVNAASWNKLLTDVGTKGATKTMADGTEFRYFQQLNPDDVSVSHTADYFSAHGAMGPTGQFVTSDVNEIFETWTLNSDLTWSISQYLFEMDSQSNVTAIYYTMLKEKDGQVLEDDQRRLSSTDPTALAMLQGKLAGWFAFDQRLK